MDSKAEINRKIEQAYNDNMRRAYTQKQQFQETQPAKQIDKTNKFKVDGDAGPKLKANCLAIGYCKRGK